MKKIIYITILLIFSCKGNHLLSKKKDFIINKHRIIIKTHSGNFIINHNFEKIKYPLSTISSPLHEEEEYHIIFPDSVLVYLSNYDKTPNFNNIKSCELCYKKWEEATREKIKEGYYQFFQRKGNFDTVTISGIDKKGNYWKERIMKNHYKIGYVNVKKELKPKFDSIIKHSHFER